MYNYFKFGPVVQEEMQFNEKVYRRKTPDARRTKTDHNAIGSGEQNTINMQLIMIYYDLVIYLLNCSIY